MLAELRLMDLCIGLVRLGHITLTMTVRVAHLIWLAVDGMLMTRNPLRIRSALYSRSKK
jgi:hypothetical protein